jgi:cell division protein FtsI/penicillin-binding protein 2
MKQDFPQRIKILKIVFSIICVIFAVRLFDLQILQHDKYDAEARAQQEKKSILTARRGKILVQKNRYSSELTPLATNHTLKMLFIDPLLLAQPNFGSKDEIQMQERGNPQLVAQMLTPLLINAHCEEIDSCPLEMDPQKMSPPERTIVETYQKKLSALFMETERRRVVLDIDVDPLRQETIMALNLPGISIEQAKIIADPLLISTPDQVAKELAPFIGSTSAELAPLLEKRKKRYVEISRKISPAISEKILELKRSPEFKKLFRGIQLTDEHWRYYPEKTLASQTIGFLDRTGNGQYGIEGRFDEVLRGQEGEISGATSTSGQQILGIGSDIRRAKDGSDVILSIDRVIQNAVEKILEADVKNFDADSGQAIVIEPQTGRILAMAHAPTFDPNNFGDVFSTFEVTPEQEELDRADKNFNQRIPTLETEENRLFRYFNLWGPAVFRNKIVSDEYEPGSVIKSFTMSAAINADEVTPQTTFDDSGPVEVDEFKIRNSDEEYRGPTTMIDVINRSLNTGIAFITRKMGAQMLYEYFKNFGFGQFTDIEIDGEAKGQLAFWKDWTESELVTRGFGQGFTASPLQVAMAYGALANGGYLMKPLLVEKIISPEGEEEIFEPERIRRVISEETYQTIKAMLLNSVENGVARGARIKGHSIMGKTGTSQTYKKGKALTGLGTTIASFAGFAPYEDPKFVILIKLDHPKASQWGSETAAGIFRKIAVFLFDYYQIPPEE